MTRNIKFLISSIAVLLVASSCLEKLPDGAIPEDEAMKSTKDADQVVYGIYSALKSSSLFSGYLTLLPDIQADMVQAMQGNTNTYGDFWRWDIRSTNREIESVYAGLYTVIGRCNFYLDQIDDVMARETDDDNLEALDRLTGEVYTIRALCYSELARCFCKAYDPDTADMELGLVLRTSYFTEQAARRASLKETYGLIVSDLEKAESLLPEKGNIASSAYITLAAANALHARVALDMQDWAAAIEYSTVLIEDTSHFLLASTTQTFGGYNFEDMWTADVGYEIIWRIGFTITSYGGRLGSVFLNYTTDYTYYYPDYIPSDDAVALYSSSDLRRGIYFRGVQTGYESGAVVNVLWKYNGNTSFISNLIYHVSMPKPFRLAEMYLIRAEAYCRQEVPNYSRASADLTALRETRYQTGGTINVNENNWLDNISDERFRELYMEGFRLHDLKRWGRGFERHAQSYTQNEGNSLKIEPGNPLFVWPIPKHELEAPGSEVLPNESNN